MNQSQRPTALGVARARFVEGLPRKAQELRASLALLVATPAEPRPREELRRRVHALWASAQVFQIEELGAALKDAIDRIDRARDERRPLGDADFEALGAMAQAVPKLAEGSPERAHAVPSGLPPAMQEPASLRPGPAEVVPWETVFDILVVGPQDAAQRIRALLDDDRFEVTHVGVDEVRARAEQHHPDVVLLEADWLASQRFDPSSLRGTLERRAWIAHGSDAARARLVGAIGTAKATAPESFDRVAIRRAIVDALRGWDGDRAHRAFREAKASFFEGAEHVASRIDHRELVELLTSIANSDLDGQVTVRDATSVIELRVRGGRFVEATRTLRDGSFSRGERVLLGALLVDAARVELERVVGLKRTTLSPTPPLDVTAALARAEALRTWITPTNMASIEATTIDRDAAKDVVGRADEGLVEALRNGRSPAELVRGGEPEADVARAILVLARCGAVTALYDANEESLLDRAVPVVSLRRDDASAEVARLAATAGLASSLGLGADAEQFDEGAGGQLGDDALAGTPLDEGSLDDDALEDDDDLPGFSLPDLPPRGEDAIDVAPPKAGAADPSSRPSPRKLAPPSEDEFAREVSLAIEASAASAEDERRTPLATSDGHVSIPPGPVTRSSRPPSGRPPPPTAIPLDRPRPSSRPSSRPRPGAVRSTPPPAAHLGPFVPLFVVLALFIAGFVGYRMWHRSASSTPPLDRPTEMVDAGVSRVELDAAVEAVDAGPAVAPMAEGHGRLVVRSDTGEIVVRRGDAEPVVVTSDTPIELEPGLVEIQVTRGEDVLVRFAGIVAGHESAITIE